MTDAIRHGARSVTESTGRAAGEMAGTAKQQTELVADEVVRRLAERSDRVAVYLTGRQRHARAAEWRQLRRRRAGGFLLGAAFGGFLLGWIAHVLRARATSRAQNAPAEQEQVIDLTTGSRTVEATVERLGSIGRDPYATGR